MNCCRLGMKRNWLVGIVAVWLIGFGLVLSDAQDSAPTATSPPMQSLFPGDTCAPPCWFGVVAGETTSEGVEAILPTIENLGSGVSGDKKVIMADTETRNMIEGFYFFNLGPWERKDYSKLDDSISIKDSIVYKMEIEPYIVVSLSKALEKLGKPDSIRLIGHPYFFYFHLIYLMARLEVWTVFEKQAESDCRIERAGSDFWVDWIIYHSAISAVEPVVDSAFERIGLGKNPQPDLTAYMVDERDVSETTLQSWFNGDVQETCVDAWKSLPKDVVYPTLVPTIEPGTSEQP